MIEAIMNPIMIDSRIQIFERGARGRVPVSQWLTVICAVYEFVTFIREGVEGIEIIFRGKIVLEAARRYNLSPHL